SRETNSVESPEGSRRLRHHCRKATNAALNLLFLAESHRSQCIKRFTHIAHSLDVSLITCGGSTKTYPTASPVKIWKRRDAEAEDQLTRPLRSGIERRNEIALLGVIPVQRPRNHVEL